MKHVTIRHHESSNVYEFTRTPHTTGDLIMDDPAAHQARETVAHALHDPVCGMAVTLESEHRFVHEGATHFFCSARCLAKFQEEPSRYLAGEDGVHRPGEPQDAGIYNMREPRPGACPKCSMAFEPEMPSLSTKTQYTCPMHPELVHDSPVHTQSAAWRSSR
jgi:YHS domain-containing protein